MFLQKIDAHIYTICEVYLLLYLRKISKIQMIHSAYVADGN